MITAIEQGLLAGAIAQPAAAACGSIVIIPAKNEALSLSATLDALRCQVDLRNLPLNHDAYEVILLLNNCDDASATVAKRYARQHPGFRLHVLEVDLPPAEAHVGTARRALMDLACERLELLGDDLCRAILSTDADTQVAPDWIAQNLRALEGGADVAGGVIHLFAEDLLALDAGTRLAYERDQAFQQRVAHLESLLDPAAADPWPRHLQHFGASLACTPAIYRKSGGLPAVKPLEDMAFIAELRRIDARIRHAPDVHIFTSARLDGRAPIGLSGQLRLWQQQSARNLPQIVESAEWLAHRFRLMGLLRAWNRHAADDELLPALPDWWLERLHTTRARSLPTARFLEELDCDGLIETLYKDMPTRPARHAEITCALTALDHAIAKAAR